MYVFLFDRDAIQYIMSSLTYIIMVARIIYHILYIIHMQLQYIL